MKKILVLSLLALSSLSIASFANKQTSYLSYSDDLAQWKKINTTNNLPHTPIAVAAAPYAEGDFVAVASDDRGSDYSIYLLDSANLNNGWQKKCTFAQSSVYKALYTNNRFVITGRDLKGNLDIITASDSPSALHSESNWQLVQGEIAHFLDSDNFIDIFKLSEDSGETDFVGIGSDCFEPTTSQYSFHHDITATAQDAFILVGIAKDGSSYFDSYSRDLEKSTK